MSKTTINSKWQALPSIVHEMIDIALFMIITYSLHLLWWNFIWDYKELLFLDKAAGMLAHGIYTSSSAILDWMGVNHLARESTLYFKDAGYITVSISCSGLKQMYQVTLLLLLFPGRTRTKFWFIPAGILVLYWVNILRIVVLSFILMIYPDVWDFSHDWILRPFFYVVIFGVWLTWLKYFSGRNDT